MQLQTSTKLNLASPPDKSISTLPVSTNYIVLPFHDLSWENFEKFCYQLGCRKMECLDTAYMYGRSGQKQDGIDIYFRHESNKKVWQIKRYKSFEATDLANAVSTFITGKWYGQIDEFTLCVSSYLNDTHIVDEIDKQADILLKNNTKLTVLDSEKLTLMSKQYPELIEMFFGKYWLDALGISNTSSVNYDTKPIAIRDLLITKLKELLLPASLVIINILLNYLNALISDYLPLFIIVTLLKVVVYLAIPITAICILIELMSVLNLKITGRICCFYSKLGSVFTFIASFINPKNSLPFPIRRVFKNENTAILEINGCSCPHCQCAPTGYMYPRRKNSNAIVFVCDQNYDHTKEMDPKERIL